MRELRARAGRCAPERERAVPGARRSAARSRVRRRASARSRRRARACGRPSSNAPRAALTTVDAASCTYALTVVTVTVSGEVRPARAKSSWRSATRAATMTVPIIANSFLSSRFVTIGTTSSAGPRAAAAVRADQATQESRRRRVPRIRADRRQPSSARSCARPISPASPGINAPPPVSTMPASISSPARSGGLASRIDQAARAMRSIPSRIASPTSASSIARCAGPQVAHVGAGDDAGSRPRRRGRRSRARSSAARRSGGRCRSSSLRSRAVIAASKVSPPTLIESHPDDAAQRRAPRSRSYRRRCR